MVAMGLASLPFWRSRQPPAASIPQVCDTEATLCTTFTCLYLRALDLESPHSFSCHPYFLSCSQVTLNPYVNSKLMRLLEAGTSVHSAMMEAWPIPLRFLDWYAILDEKSFLKCFYIKTTMDKL